jgi:hypothetical protein
MDSLLLAASKSLAVSTGTTLFVGVCREQQTLMLSFLPSKVFHHLYSNLAAVQLPDFHHLAGVDGDEFHLSCSHACSLK